ncbi:hypothetical protein T4C_9323, partial [Trichinella pseudospiralis]
LFTLFCKSTLRFSLIRKYLFLNMFAFSKITSTSLIIHGLLLKIKVKIKKLFFKIFLFLNIIDFFISNIFKKKRNIIIITIVVSNDKFSRI